jgi:hypothetical protein
MTKPADFIERSAGEFEAPASVDVASVPANADPKDMLMGKNPPPTDAEPQGEEFFKWDGETQEFYVEVDNNGRTERFAGKSRTEVTRNLAEGKKNANQALAERTQSQRTRTPDTKLPYDPIARKQPRQLSQQEVFQINELAQTDPLKAQEMAFEARTGYTFEAVAQSIQFQDENRHKIYAAEVSGDFISAHQKDFHPNPSNMSLIDGWLKERKLPVTRNNLEIAFYELSENGKLTRPQPAAVKPPEQEFTPPPPPVSPPSRPAPSATVQQGGLSREQVATIQTGSLSDARAVIQSAFRRSRGGR